MRKTWFCVFTLFALVAGNRIGAASSSALSQTPSKPDAHIIESLPPPDDEEIRKIRTPDQWHNPFLVVNSAGYELILHDQKRNQTLLTLEELEETLLQLPRERWPLGRVIAVVEPGLRSPDDTPKIDANLKAAIRMLESHKLRVDQIWPSG